MSHLGENLASKGFVVVVDRSQGQHLRRPEARSRARSTTAPFDQLFVLERNRAPRQAAAPGSFLSRPASTPSRTGVVGYSMGGYGVVNVIGGGYSKASETLDGAPPNQLLAERGAANPGLPQDASIRGSRRRSRSRRGACRPDSGTPRGCKGITTPVLFVAGSVDDVAGYEKGTKAIYQAAVNADRYLLTFVNAEPQRRRADSGAGGDLRAIRDG